jgi:NADPH:quinone reductase-like Zn-dependent oxidoreductase
LAANDANVENGAFARYIAVKEDIQMHIPDNVSFEAAATTGVGIGTTGYALYKVLGLPLPDSTAGNHSSQSKAREVVLIYGGSTATGSLAIQLAKLYVTERKIHDTIID